MLGRFIPSALMTAVAVGLVACGSSGGGSSGSSSGTEPAAATKPATTAADAGTTVEQSTIDAAAQFVGVAPGKADASLPPVKIGFVNQQGGVPSFDEHNAAADATVKLINEHLGGIDGHPIELDKCVIATEEDGQKCAGQLLNAGVPVADLGLAVVGNAPLYKTIKGKFPVIVNGQGGGADVTTPHVYLFDAGGVGMLGGLTKIATKLGAKTVAVIASGNPAGKYGMEQILAPALKAAGLEYKVVYAPDDATAPDYVSALQAAGGSKADVVMLELLSLGCQNSYDAMKQLGIAKPVIGIQSCYSDAFVSHAGGNLKDWYFSGFTTNPRIAADPQAVAYRNIMKAYGQEKWTFVGIASKTLQDLLLLTKFGDKLGYSGINAQALDTEIRAYRGPGFLVPGQLKCDGKTPGTPGVCGTEAAGSTFKDGAFVPFALN